MGIKPRASARTASNLDFVDGLRLPADLFCEIPPTEFGKGSLALVLNRELTAVMTVVDGRIVHETAGALPRVRGWLGPSLGQGVDLVPSGMAL